MNPPTTIYLIFEDGKCVGNATSILKRDQLVRYYDSVPGSGYVIWQEYQNITPTKRLLKSLQDDLEGLTFL